MGTEVKKFVLSQRSIDRLQGVHPDLVAVVKRAIELACQDFMVVEGLRTVERQRELVAKGASKTMSSYHLPQATGYGHAVDLAPLVGKEIPWSDWAAFAGMADTVKSAAQELGVPIEWGGDWKTFKDGPHFQIPRAWRGRA
ncbi:MAG: hypothetical protein KER_03104 [Kerstersia gyiorum]|uniref:M15 family metallopeptidase n=1 Tax=Kerstersia gyiorum TaxID=206506 RepID=UPI0030CEC346